MHTILCQSPKLTGNSSDFCLKEICSNLPASQMRQSCAARKFMKLLKPALSELHEKGHISSAYIDDLYLQGSTYDDCAVNVIDNFTLFHSLGFTPHPDKSNFKPSQRMDFLGFTLDSIEMTITLPSDKAHKLLFACLELLHETHPTIREVARVIGLLSRDNAWAHILSNLRELQNCSLEGFQRRFRCTREPLWPGKI